MARQDLETLVVQLSADIKKYENAMNRAQSVTNQQFRAIERRALLANTNLSSSFTALSSTALKALALIGGAKGFQTLADSATNITNALKVAGLSGDALTETYDKLFAAAQRNSAPLESLVQLYSRVSLVQGQLGASSDDIVGLTDNVGKALRLSGQSASEASGALLQLAQALGGGTIQAQEYDSLIDGLPGLLQAAAAGIKQAGGDVSKLTALVKSGQISNKAFFDGIAAGSHVLDERLGGATSTIGQAFTQLYNSMTDFVGKFDKSTGAADRFAEGISRIAGALSTADPSGFFNSINQALDELNQKLGSIGNSDVFKWLNHELGATDDNGNIINIDATKASEEISGLERELKQMQDHVALNTELGFDSSGAMERIDEIKKQLGDLQQQAANIPATVPSVKLNAPVQGPNLPTPATAPVPSKRPLVDITDPNYKPTGAKKTGSGTGRDAKAYDRETRQVKERTDVLNAQTTAQAKLNPYVNDYGYAAERAATAQELLSAAQRTGNAAGKEMRDVNQLLSGDFSKLSPAAREQAQAMLNLADASGTAAAKSQQLQDSQEKLRQTMEDWRETSKDASEGFIKDLIDGKSAVEALGGALEKLGDKLLDNAFDSLFGSSGSNNWFSSLWSSIGLKNGGPIKLAGGGKVYGPGGPRDDKVPAMLSNGEFVVNSAATKKNRALLEAINNGSVLRRANGGVISAPTLPSTASARARATGDFLHFSMPITIDNRGASAEAVAKTQQQLDKLKAELPARIVAGVRDARRHRQGI